MNEERLKALYAIASADKAGRLGPCDTPVEDMVEVLEGRATEAKRQETLRRLLANPACKEEFELLRAVVSAAGGSRRPRLNPAWRWAAGIVVLLGAAWWWRAERPEDALRGGPDGIVALAPVGLTGTPTVPLTWHPAANVFRYEVVLVDSTGQARFTGSTTDSMLVLPDTLHLTTGAVYRWWVRAMGRDGTEVHSRTVSFTIRP